MVGPRKPPGQRINLQHCNKKSICACVSRLCSSFVNEEIFTAVSVCSSILANLFCSEGAILSLEYRFEGFEGFFSDSPGCDEEEFLKNLFKMELRVFVYFSLVGEPLMVFGKTFYWREAEKEGADVEPLKNGINAAGSLFREGEHLVAFYSGLFWEKLNISQWDLGQDLCL